MRSCAHCRSGSSGCRSRRCGSASRSRSVTELNACRSPHLPRRRSGMKTRHLGASGLNISEIAYGHWLTHRSQVEEDAALACVRAALDVGITTFDTADVYANTRAETVLGKALAAERRESLEIFTKVFWRTGPGGPNDQGLSRKHILEAIDGSL